MSQRLVFDWHDAKHLSNRAKHGIGFDEAIALFLDGDRIDFDASRPEDGEERRKTVGRIEGRLMTVVYAPRGEVRWIISARPANKPEKRRYDQG